MSGALGLANFVSLLSSRNKFFVIYALRLVLRFGSWDMAPVQGRTSADTRCDGGRVATFSNSLRPHKIEVTGTFIY